MNKKIVPNPLTLQSILNYSTEHFANQPSVSFVEGTPITYSELKIQIDHVSDILFSLGLKRGDKVALLSHNMPNWVIAYFAVVSNGLVIIPILPDFTHEEIENVLFHSEAKALFVSERLLSRVEDLELPSLEAQILLDDFTLKMGNTDIKDNVEQPKITVKEDDLA